MIFLEMGISVLLGEKSCRKLCINDFMFERLQGGADAVYIVNTRGTTVNHPGVLRVDTK